MTPPLPRCCQGRPSTSASNCGRLSQPRRRPHAARRTCRCSGGAPPATPQCRRAPAPSCGWPAGWQTGRRVRACSTEDGHHAGQRGVCAGTHVQRLGSQPQGVDADHLSKSRIQAAQCSAAETGQVSDTLVAPRRSSMRMSGAGTQLGAGSATGTKVGTCTSVLGAWARRRHLCTTLALMPCESATLATEASGWCTRPGSAAHARRCAADGSWSWLRSWCPPISFGGHHRCRLRRRPQGWDDRTLTNERLRRG